MTPSVRETEQRVRLVLRAIPSGPLLVAASGGLDSTVLVYLAAQERPIVLGHVRHGLRPEAEQQQDEFLLRSLADRLSAPIHCVGLPAGTLRDIAVRQGRSVEEVAREHRYRLLTDLARELGAVALLTGHHVQDTVETLLMRIAGGRGWRGTHGIPERRLYRGTYIVRPFIAIGEPYPTRADLLAVAAAADLPHVEDSSNVDSVYLRNRVRHELLPLLRDQFGPGVDRSLARFAADVASLQRWIGAETRLRLAWSVINDDLGERWEMSASTFFAAPLAMREFALREALFSCTHAGHRLSMRAFRPLLREYDSDEMALIPTRPQDRSMQYGSMQFHSADVVVIVRDGVVIVRAQLVRYLQSGYLWPINSCSERGSFVYRHWKIGGLHSPAVVRNVQRGDRLPAKGHNAVAVRIVANKVGELVEDTHGVAVYWRRRDEEPTFVRSDIVVQAQDVPQTDWIVETENEDALGYAE